MPARPKKTLAADLKGYLKGRDNENPVWGGPTEEGITQSMLHEYLNCQERFRIWTIEGLRGNQDFDVKIEYGQMWHILEEVNSAGGSQGDREDALKEYCRVLARKYRMRGAEIQKWYRVSTLQFEVYLDYWGKHHEEVVREPLFQEKVFGVNYKLPSGRYVLLRGKIDAADRIMDADQLYFLQENKSKGSLNEERISLQLSFDLQTMKYLVAFEDFVKPDEIGGVRYNTVMRPLSGGKGTIRRHKQRKRKPTKKDPRDLIPAETWDHYYGRLKKIISDEPERFFKRWTVEISREDVERYKEEFLHPVLENLLDDYEWWSYCKQPHVFGKASPFNYRERASNFPNHANRHWRFPYGVWRSTSDGWKHPLDDYLKNGSRVGLNQVSTFFEEL